MNQLYNLLKKQSNPLDEVPTYIKQKLEEKQKLDEQIKEAHDILQSKNIATEAINEYLSLKEEFEKYEICTQDIDKLLNLLKNAKEHRFDGKKIVTRLRSIKRLEKKQNGLKISCEMLSKQLQEYNRILPLTEEIAALGIGIDELIALKASINQAVKYYSLPALAAVLRLIDDIRKYEKVGGLKKELERLSLQKFAINVACARHAQAFVTAAKMQNHGLRPNEHYV